MGAATSISNTEVINYNDFVIDQSIRNKITQDCIVRAVSENILRITDSKVSNLTTTQSNIVKNLCILQAMIRETRDAKASQDLMTKIVKEIEAKGGLPGTGGYSESISKLYNRMSANLDQSTVNEISKNCIIQQDSKNLMEIMGSDVSGATLTQVNQTFVDCLQNYGEVRELGSDILNKASSELQESVKSTGTDLAASAVSVIFPVIILFAILRFFRII